MQPALEQVIQISTMSILNRIIQMFQELTKSNMDECLLTQASLQSVLLIIQRTCKVVEKLLVLKRLLKMITPTKIWVVDCRVP